jgi:hypothetical protein
MITVLCILALVGCGLVIASAATPKIPLWIGALLIGLVVLLQLALQVWK